MIDIVDELWEHAYEHYDEGAIECLAGRAAAELATLRAEVDRLRDALSEIARQFEMPNGHMAAYLAKEALK